MYLNCEENLHVNHPWELKGCLFVCVQTGCWGVPVNLVDRYSEELHRSHAELAGILDRLRVRRLRLAQRQAVSTHDYEVCLKKFLLIFLIGHKLENQAKKIPQTLQMKQFSVVSSTYVKITDGDIEPIQTPIISWGFALFKSAWQGCEPHCVWLF